jgi:hypothetical protein
MPLYLGCVVGYQAWIERGPQELENSIDGTVRGRGHFRDADRPGTVGGCTRLGWRHKGSLMKTGTCKLCLTPEAELHDSHFLPRSFYALFRDGKNEPIRFSPESVYPTSKQIKDFVFCGDCEERFNRDGENWVRPLLPTVSGPSRCETG